MTDETGGFRWRKRAKPSETFGCLACQILDQPIPATKVTTDRCCNLGIGPAGRDHLLKYPDVAGIEILIEMVAGALPASP
jgi:hypothetical protein